LAPGVASLWRGRLRGFCRRIGIALAAGYILVFFAERMFWSRWRPDDDNVGAFLATRFVYSIAAEI